MKKIMKDYSFKKAELSKTEIKTLKEAGLESIIEKR
jgi:hypothetical protein